MLHLLELLDLEELSLVTLQSLSHGHLVAILVLALVHVTPRMITVSLAQVGHICLLSLRLSGQELLVLLILEREKHVVRLCVQSCLVKLALIIPRLLVPYLDQLLVLLQLEERLSLLLNHVSVREGEVLDLLHCGEGSLVLYLVALLIAEQLVRLLESLTLLHLVILLETLLLEDFFALVIKSHLLTVTFDDAPVRLCLLLHVDLVDYIGE